MNRIALLILVLSVGSAAWAQDAPPVPPPDPPPPADAAAPAPPPPAPRTSPKSQAQFEPEARPEVFFIEGLFRKMDKEAKTIEVLVREEGKDPAVQVYAFTPRTRLFASDKAVKQMKDIPPGATVHIYYLRMEDGTLRVNRIMVNPPNA